ncbi:hydantoinase/oxoprolinase family protein [Methermicoccus shengliensis]|uniref:Hydantoinase/oxoprolinase family protein n=1 Tax=Methermicoccus shengliensis TaxID=660064 RepID=A0A832RWV5_9EURY|nr:hydantoinase/oxoprolinase family protein [Methermicoccus shengliensis]KUK05209.1 MAG: Hydantoinase [Euryarchaeota archaeon 55_53]KUK30828.1 MAG: Hydantoinase [Methanosarcinales archeaon 56_1174]MDI3487369.1 hypothetical protein [Methanosarcinales archaeon]MDN5294557.1 hypothetical protein [Methanosarcinales archaeon]HIH69713.1 hydantoinase/oxoprolinase family protein [Methermicoccus shengliensis]
MYSLGIDTGGTNTDSVLVDPLTKQLVGYGKAPTTHYNLAVGIENSISDLLSSTELKKPIGMVSLSTTLATNSIVEAKAREVCLILIGHPPRKEWDELPAKFVRVIGGKFDELGREEEPLDIDALDPILEEVDAHVEGYAASGYFGVRNPSHEQRVKEYIQSRTGKPVVCGHEFTAQLGLYERSVTAALNAGLIPVINELLDSVKQSLARFGISAPLYVVKGDGAIVSEAVAREHPIETVYSGPAASAVGGFHLTGRRDALVMDIGGTTTDVVELVDGMPKVIPDGAIVGGLKTRVRAIDAITFGFGGDSLIEVGDTIKVGPERAVPLKEFELAELIRRTGAVSFYVRRSAEGNEVLTNDVVGCTYSRDELSQMLRRRRIERVALTPSDILCHRGLLDGNVESVRAALEVMAERTGTDVEQLTERIEGAIMDALSRNVRYRGEWIVGIGAPAPQFVPALATTLNKHHVVPEHCEVANAFGAAVCSIMESVDIVVSRLWEMEQEEEQYIVHTPTETLVYEKLLDAIHAAVDIAKQLAIERAIRAGAASPEVKTERRDHVVMIDNTRFFLRSVITAKATGKAAPLAVEKLRDPKNV